MRLYHTPTGQWAGTQAEAKALGLFELVEVPTDKPGLLAFLNLHRVGADRVEIDYTPTITLVQPPAPPPPVPDTRGAQLAQDISVEEAIQRADYPRALYLAHQIHHRLMEHAREASR
jgi:hypothetical protein